MIPGAQERAVDDLLPCFYGTCGGHSPDDMGDGTECEAFMRAHLSVVIDQAVAQAVQAVLDEVDEIVAKWKEAYPEDVFRPFVAADHPHVSPDRIGAQMGRHMARELRKQIAALRARPAEPRGEKG